MENIHSSEPAINGVYCPCMVHTNILHCPINAEIGAVDQIKYFGNVVIVMINADTWVMLREQVITNSSDMLSCQLKFPYCR